MNSFDNLCEKTNKKIKKKYKYISEKSARLSDRFFCSQRTNIALILLIAFISFFLMFLMNTSTPYVAEDFDYHYIFADDGRKVTDERISSVSDIVTSMKAHYKTMNGRIITHAIVQMIMLIDKKAVFNVANSVMYVLFTLTVYKHCIGKSKRHSALLFLFVNLSIWLITPQWGLTTVWLLGSVNYLWMSTVRLLYLLSFRLYAEDGHEKHTVLKTVLMLLLGFTAGCSSENMGAALIGVTVLFFIFYRIKHYKFRAWFVTSFVSLVAGYCFMFFAPANSVRMAKTDSAGGSSILQRLVNIPANSILYLLPLICVGLVALIILMNKKSEKKLGVSFIYFLGSIGGIAVMFAISQFPDRAWFGIVVYMIMSVGIIVNQISFEGEKQIRQMVSLVAVLCCIWTGMSYIKAYKSAEEYMNCWDERTEYIQEQKEAGNFDLEFANIQLLNKHAPLYSWTDIGREENDPQHISIAQYFELNSIDWNKEYIIIE